MSWWRDDVIVSQSWLFDWSIHLENVGSQHWCQCDDHMTGLQGDGGPSMKRAENENIRLLPGDTFVTSRASVVLFMNT